MTSRGQWLRNKQEHDQRAWPNLDKPKKASEWADLDWTAKFMSAAEGATGTFGTDSILALQLGATEAEREVKLRKLSSKGYLVMTAKRSEDGKFERFEWRLA